MSEPTWKLLNEVHDYFARVAADIVDHGQEVEPQLFLACPTEENVPGPMAAMPPSAMEQFYGDEAGKEALAEFMRAMLTEGHPLRESVRQQAGFSPSVIVQISEAWVLENQDAAGDEDYYRGLRSISKHPRRREAVLVALHTRFGSFPSWHFIEPAPKRHCVLGPLPAEHESMLTGRFVLHDSPGQEPGGVH